MDEQNLLGDLYGFKAIPNGFLIDEQGVVRYGELGGFDIRKPKTRALVERWAEGVESARGELVEPRAEAGPALRQAQGERETDGRHAQANSPTLSRVLDEVGTHFRQGEALYKQGKVDEAVAEWRKAVALEPDNYIIRKQIWAVQNPDKFYNGDVDYDWQAEQLKLGL